MWHVARFKITVGVSSRCEPFIIDYIKELESSMQQLCVEEGGVECGIEDCSGNTGETVQPHLDRPFWSESGHQ